MKDNFRLGIKVVQSYILFEYSRWKKILSLIEINVYDSVHSTLLTSEATNELIMFTLF